jgi:hypothetical protein
LDPFSEGAKIADSLQFIVGQLDLEMLLEACEQVESLQAVDAELLEKIIVSSKFFARDIEMFRRKLEDLFSGIWQRAHNFYLAINVPDFCVT